jgi:hypothetical protein
MMFRGSGFVLGTALIGLAGCGGSPDATDTSPTPATEEGTDHPKDVGESKAALNSSCDPRYTYFDITNMDSTGTVPRSANGIVNFWSYCFNGGAQIIVWITDWNTGRELGTEQFFTAAPDNFFIPGFFSGSISGCPSTGEVMLHAIDLVGQRRADISFYIKCP